VAALQQELDRAPGGDAGLRTYAGMLSDAAASAAGASDHGPAGLDGHTESLEELLMQYQYPQA
jgi:hypothetical protein